MARAVNPIIRFASRPRVLLAIAGVTAASPVWNAGESETAAQTETRPNPAAVTGELDPGYKEAAEAICRQTTAEIRALAARLVSQPPAASDSPSQINESVVRPGSHILAQEGSRLRALAPRPESADLDTFIGLYDPVVILARQSLRTADPDAARRLQGLAQGLEQVQGRAARRIGLRSCSVGFLDTLVGRPPAR